MPCHAAECTLLASRGCGRRRRTEPRCARYMDSLPSVVQADLERPGDSEWAGIRVFPDVRCTACSSSMHIRLTAYIPTVTSETNDVLRH